MKLFSNQNQYPFLTNLYSSKKTESVYLVGAESDLRRVKLCLNDSELQVVGVGDSIKEIEDFIEANEPDALIINIDKNYEDLSGFQITKLLKMEFDLPFIVLQNSKTQELDKWVSELNPDGLIYHDQSIDDTKTVIGKAFN